MTIGCREKSFRAGGFERRRPRAARVSRCCSLSAAARHTNNGGAASSTSEEHPSRHERRATAAPRLRLRGVAAIRNPRSAASATAMNRPRRAEHRPRNHRRALRLGDERDGVANQQRSPQTHRPFIPVNNFGTPLHVQARPSPLHTSRGLSSLRRRRDRRSFHTREERRPPGRRHRSDQCPESLPSLPRSPSNRRQRRCGLDDAASPRGG